MSSTEGSTLAERGWARYQASHFIDHSSDDHPASLNAIRDFYRELPADRYAPHSHRYRRHARAVYLPWERQLSWLPNAEDQEVGEVVDYDMQGYNEEFPDLKRQYPAIPRTILDNPLIERIVRFDLAQTMWLNGFPRTPLNVGVGCIKLAVNGEHEEAAATPNALHQDGGAVSFTFIHLIFRDNVDGGVNYVAPTRCVGFLPEELSGGLIDAEFTLEQPLDGFAVHNSRVSHHVSAIRRGDRAESGERGVMIVAISPLAKQL